MIVSASVAQALLFMALILVYYFIDPHTLAIREMIGGKFSGKTLEFAGLTLSVPAIALVLVGVSTALRTPIWPDPRLVHAVDA